jgi:serine/threonine-protein kinase
MRINLTVKAGPHAGAIFEFKQRANFIVGRSERAHFQLPIKDKNISRIHFMIEMNPPQCRAIDMGSTNGTRVNGQPISIADLKDGDLITAGETVLLVSVVDSGDSTADYPAVVAQPPAAAGAAAGAFRAMPVSERRRAPNRNQAGCRVCADPDAHIRQDSPGELGKVDAVPLCFACLGRIRNQAQPVPGYLVVRELGRGGMGIVYQALRVEDGELVAVKTIKPAVIPTAEDVERFLREARILHQLDHPNIVSFHEMGEFSGQLHFAMDYVAGIDASRLLKQARGPLPVARATHLVCQLLQALDYAHAKGFVHRDVKPDNVLVTQEGGREVLKLTDFGLARLYQNSKISGLTMNGQLGGTAAFMAPEQITELRDAGPPADQYSAGATLYNLLTDCFVYDFPDRFEAKIMKILLDEPVPIRTRRPDLPDSLAEIIHRALARDQQARFESVRDMRRALAPFAR